MRNDDFCIRNVNFVFEIMNLHLNEEADEEEEDDAEEIRSISPIDPTASGFTIDPRAHAARLVEQKRIAEEHKEISTAAAVALQRELMEHGTRDMEKINTLRRASMAPDDAGAAMAAASAMME